MAYSIKQKLKEGLELFHASDATKNKYIVGELEENEMFERARNGGIKKYQKKS